jgi:hypothetical protein
MPGFLHSIRDLTVGRFTRSRDSIRQRRHTRHEVSLRAELQLTDRALTLDGMILEISRGGLLYREATHHILDRRGASVTVRIPGRDISGTILNVSSAGYGIALHEMLSDYALEQIISCATGPVTDSFATTRSH